MHGCVMHGNKELSFLLLNSMKSTEVQNPRRIPMQASVLIG